MSETIEQQQEDIDELKAIAQQLASSSEKEKGSHQLTLSNKALLGQNYPNPFSNNTEIPYFIPDHAQTASFLVTGIDGKIIERIDNIQKGEGTIRIDAIKYQNGIFSYSLMVDGNIVTTKKMTHNK